MANTPITALQGEYHEQHALARYTSWRVGGEAERFYRPKDLDDLQLFLQQLPSDEPITWLGLGSNVLIRDGGIPGTVILTLNRLNQLRLLDEHTVYVQAGVTCAKLSKFCVKHGFEKGAFFAGIPGTVGGALAMNAGAYGGETWPHVQRVMLLDRYGVLTEHDAAEFKVGYREVHWPKDCYFAAGIFHFDIGDGGQTKQDLKALMKKRNDSQPIGSLSCGSVFRNPPGDHAARLIESCGLKGYRIGGAMVSKKHANFILNDDGATAADLESLIRYVHDTVLLKAGVDLIQECHFLGVAGKTQ